ncbi:MAG: hypothetical protein Kow0025_23270 [Thermodesulfovibrionales bacterium]
MMRKLAFALAVVVCFVVETRLAPAGLRLNLTLLPVYWAGLRHGPARGLLTGALVGAALDSISGGILGPSMLGKGLAGYLASLMTGGLFRWTPVLGLLGLAVLTVADGAVSYASLAAFAQAPAPAGEAALAIAAQGVMNSIAGLYIRPDHEAGEL